MENKLYFDVTYLNDESEYTTKAIQSLCSAGAIISVGNTEILLPWNRICQVLCRVPGAIKFEVDGVD